MAKTRKNKSHEEVASSMKHLRLVTQVVPPDDPNTAKIRKFFRSKLHVI